MLQRKSRQIRENPYEARLGYIDDCILNDKYNAMY